nr:NADH dehydrogenase subunit 2 [Acinopterus sp.]
MKFNLTYALLMNTMMIGVIMVISSNNWAVMWMGIEISMMSFIPIMKNKNMLSAESTMKYFISQSIASMLFLMSVILMLIGVNYSTLMSISMVIKMGAAPFHNWMLMIVEWMSYSTILLMLTILKIPPMLILMYSGEMSTIIIITSMMIGSIMALNQSSIKKILVYSSVFNLGMMMTSINLFNTWMSYLMIYSLMMILMTNSINELKINFISQMMSNESSLLSKMSLWMNMLSMGGFPPLIGFINKMMIIQSLMVKNEVMMMLIVMLSSMVMLFFYIRVTFTSIMFYSMSTKWMLPMNKTIKANNYLNLLLSLSMLSIKSLK